MEAYRLRQECFEYVGRRKAAATPANEGAAGEDEQGISAEPENDLGPTILESPFDQEQDDKENEALEALGALADAAEAKDGLEDGEARLPKIQASARSRKRAFIKARNDSLQGMLILPLPISNRLSKRLVSISVCHYEQNCVGS